MRWPLDISEKTQHLHMVNCNVNYYEKTGAGYIADIFNKASAPLFRNLLGLEQFLYWESRMVKATQIQTSFLEV